MRPSLVSALAAHAIVCVLSTLDVMVDSEFGACQPRSTATSFAYAAYGVVIASMGCEESDEWSMALAMAMAVVGGGSARFHTYNFVELRPGYDDGQNEIEPRDFAKREVGHVADRIGMLIAICTITACAVEKGIARQFAREDSDARTQLACGWRAPCRGLLLKRTLRPALAVACAGMVFHDSMEFPTAALLFSLGAVTSLCIVRMAKNRAQALEHLVETIPPMLFAASAHLTSDKMQWVDRERAADFVHSTWHLLTARHLFITCQFLCGHARLAVVQNTDDYGRPMVVAWRLVMLLLLSSVGIWTTWSRARASGQSVYFTCLGLLWVDAALQAVDFVLRASDTLVVARSSTGGRVQRIGVEVELPETRLICV